MPEPVLGVVGLGRLGEAVARLCAQEKLTVRRFDSRQPDQWAGLPVPDVLIDCAAPPAVHHVIDLSERLHVPLVECVSDLGDDHHARLAELAREVAVVRATNLSLGNYLLTRAVEDVARVLRVLERAGITGVMPEAAVLERHPAAKAHRPSATATALAAHWTGSAGGPISDISSLRAGRMVSAHEIRLTWEEQDLTIRHEVHSLAAAASGAIGVGTWAVGQAPGLYDARTVFDRMLESMSGHHEGVHV
ncbi:dihydrodipicolinate reductase C-terminal domain-containing protein [Sphaerisporangium sp. NPDC088356]|uniref:dihydrodipicolinate reductase C-terminal domain-containing protein n=1 Tax=Sphaerisporangium sp. NPDC088356 TaxID=3154871 RepID=UPI00342E6413